MYRLVFIAIADEDNSPAQSQAGDANIVPVVPVRDQLLPGAGTGRPSQAQLAERPDGYIVD